MVIHISISVYITIHSYTHRPLTLKWSMMIFPYQLDLLHLVSPISECRCHTWLETWNGTFSHQLQPHHGLLLVLLDIWFKPNLNPSEDHTNGFTNGNWKVEKLSENSIYFEGSRKQSWNSIAFYSDTGACKDWSYLPVHCICLHTSTNQSR